MRRLLKPFGLALGLFASATLVGSCSPDRPLGIPLRPAFGLAAISMPSVRISEIHYDNGGTDAGERIEVSFPTGTDLTGYSVVLYNGAGGAAYDTKLLNSLSPSSCGDRSVVVVSYAVNGIQNGAPDGMALVKSGTLIEFLSYEGTFTGSGGAANAVLSTDIGASQAGTEAAGSSLQRTGSGNWIATVGATANSFGACNDVLPPTTPVAAITVAPTEGTIAAGSTLQLKATAFDESGNEILGAPLNWESSAPALVAVSGNGLVTAIDPPGAEITVSAPSEVEVRVQIVVTEPHPPLPPTDIFISEFHYDNSGDDIGEAIEVSAPAGTSFTGWSLVLYNGNGAVPYSTISLDGASLSSCSDRALATVPAVGVQNGEPDGIALVNPAGALVEFLSYEGRMRGATGAAKGYKSIDVGVEEGNQLPGRSLQRDAIGWYGPNPSSFGSCNAALPPFLSLAADRANLPVGFEGQVFATYNDGRGGNTSATATWSSDTPEIATVDADGVVHGNASGTAILRATTTEGVTGTASLPIIIATRGTGVYGNHIEFGTPTDANPADDVIISREFYTSSFSNARGIPNWVSYNIEATHQGSFDRCNCFTYDPELPAEKRYTTADYTGVGGDTPYHGYPIDRGHLLRSFDRTSGSLDNANTYYFSNIIPQTADNNQGPWAALELYLGNLASGSNKELFVIAGVSGSIGTVKDEGKITIPEWTWKVALILPRDQGLANVDSYDDVEVIAVIMPNVPGIRNVEWETYKTTVDAIEALSGYDLLSLLPDQVEIAVESNTRPPVAAINGPFTLNESGSISVSATGSSDPEGGALTYTWNFGDGGTATGLTATHTYASFGSYTVTVTATDPLGLTGSASTTAAVANVVPTIGPFNGATILPHETYTASGSFTDPGANTWGATVNYGDGSGVQSLTLSGNTFSLSHTYATPGSFTVTVSINDGAATSTHTATVVVDSWAKGFDNLGAALTALNLPKGTANSLQAKLNAALKQIENENSNSPAHVLDAFVNELQALVNSGRLTAAAAAPLIAYAERLGASLVPQ